MTPPIFNEKGFLDNLLLDESREAYHAMSVEQKKVVRLAYLHGYVHAERVVKGGLK